VVSLRPPKLPPVERMPVRRTEKSPSVLARGVAGIAGLALGFSAAIGVWRALSDSTGGASPFMALAALLPAVILVRYAMTGQIKT